MSIVRLEVKDQVDELATLPASQKAPTLPTTKQTVFPFALAPWVKYLALASTDREHSHFFKWDFKPIVGVNSCNEGRIVGPEATVNKLILLSNDDGGQNKLERNRMLGQHPTLVHSGPGRSRHGISI